MAPHLHLHLFRYCRPPRPGHLSLATSHRIAPALLASGSLLGNDRSSHSSYFHSSSSSHSPRRNHYEQLGLSQDASKKEIKTQFYRLSKLHHPDKNDSEESRQRFLHINEAYSVLGDDRQRRDYDLTLLDRSGQLYSSSAGSYSSSASSRPSARGTLRRTPFRHSKQSATAAAEARAHAAFRPTYGGKPSASHFDSKSHQEMHYEQEVRREERRQARERASEEFKWRQQYEESDTMAGKLSRIGFIFVAIFLASSMMRVFADDETSGGSDREEDEEKEKGSKMAPSYLDQPPEYAGSTCTSTIVQELRCFSGKSSPTRIPFSSGVHE
ncbi:DnaJ homolog subfamily C member 30 [Entomortierella parvispora]|uniref:DnaJ homolog subfamily C member 30 n=1 Tax=Entomortierella parvispora TaxID=205924 RepID=A0A9P3LUH5_9FUNG|nr:DnaJ homolog subfamily C member 30 [Entomortierella parvispora]